jgi:uncharacterized protein (TIGR02270 family)
MPIIESIITQHAEEAAFLWLLRDTACHEPHYSLKDLAKLDDRVEAHLDGLRVAGDEGLSLYNKVWSMEDAGEIFAASELAFENSDPDHIDRVLKIAASTLELSRGVISALGWLPYDQASMHIGALLGAGNAELHRIGLAACVAHRRDPGGKLASAVDDKNPMLKARALRAVGQLGRIDLLPLVLSSLGAEDIDCRFSAAWSGALLGDMQAIPALKFVAELDVPYREEAAKMALRRMDLQAAYGWQRELAQSPDSIRLAVIGSGVIGDPVSVSWLLEQMRIPALARVAGEAFAMITGVDIAYEDLEGEWPEGFEAGPTENPEDEKVDMDPDENLPWPNPKLIEGWWHKNKQNFKNGVRYLSGKPISDEQCQHVLRYGYQRQRAAAAIELAMMHPGTPVFNVKAPGFRQLVALGLKTKMA